MTESTQGRWRWLGFVAAGLVGAVAGNLFGVARADFGGAGGFGGHHRFFMRHGGGGPEQMGEHAQFAVDMAFRAVSNPNYVYDPDKVGQVGQLLEAPVWSVRNQSGAGFIFNNQNSHDRESSLVAEQG